MSLLHKLRVQLRNKRKDLRHILNSLIKALEGLESLDILIVLRVSLFTSHFSALRDETVGVDLVPKDFLPGSKLRINKGNKIPVFLKVNEINFAVIKHLKFRLS
jgi:hypothetical protein